MDGGVMKCFTSLIPHQFANENNFNSLKNIKTYFNPFIETCNVRDNP